MNKKCYHHEDCGNIAEYDLDTADDETISVCEECDEDYGVCEVCKKCALDFEMSRYNPTDDYLTCDKCRDRLEYELEIALREDVKRFIVSTMPSYHNSVNEWFINSIVEDVKETSGFEDEHQYNESDIALAFQRVIVVAIEGIDTNVA